MAYLLDTGILLRLFDRSHADHALIRSGISILRANRERLYTASQNIAEFWNVSTRPTTARGGFGLSVPTVALRIGFIERLCTILTNDRQTYLEWKLLLRQHQIIGVAVHDARLVAAMGVHHVGHILTLNSQDFRRYSNIVVVEPRSISPLP